MERLRSNKHGSQSSRFGVSSDEWEIVIKPVLAEELGLEVNQVRLERTIEANIISQLYPDMPCKNNGIIDTWVLYEEYFEVRDHRLNSSHSDFGGLVYVHYSSAGVHWNNGSFRPLAAL